MYLEIQCNMKIRNGFVSNSSTSSFCIFGIYLDKYEGDEYELEKKARELGLEMEYPPYGNPAIGRSFSSIKDDETGAQFKQSVRDNLAKLGLPTDKVSLCEEAWYDG